MKSLIPSTFKLPNHIKDKLANTAKQESRTQTAIIVIALEGYFSKRAKSTKPEPIIEAQK